MDIVIATNNSSKLSEIREILGGAFTHLYSLADLNIDVDVVENASTFEGNALKKAREICTIANLPALADDSGLAVEALGGAPGIYSARFAGTPCNNEKNNEKLLASLKNVTDRRAKFISVVALVYPDGRELTARGETYGEILYRPMGDGGFGYDPLFLSHDLNKTFAEATSEEKHQVSHRGKALRALLKQVLQALD